MFLENGFWCLVVLVISILFIVIGTSKYKFNAFIIMLFVSFFYGIATGLGFSQTINSIKTGFGDFFVKTGLLYACGIIIGVILEKTGAAISIARFMLKIFGAKQSPITLALSGYLVSIPTNCDSGFIILSPMSKAISQATKYSLIGLNTILACGLYLTHSLVPPTAGPTSAAIMTGADLGLVIIFGLIVASISLFICYLYIKNKKCKGQQYK